MGQGSAYVWRLKVLSSELVCRTAAEPRLPVCTVPREGLLLCGVEKMVVKTSALRAPAAVLQKPPPNLRNIKRDSETFRLVKGQAAQSPTDVAVSPLGQPWLTPLASAT